MADPLALHIARAALPLPPLTELSEKPKALEPLSALIGGARVVALGESFHHTHEQLVLRGVLVRHLIARLGFNFVVLEVVTPGPNPIHAYVNGAGDDASSALIEAGARMWRNQETAALMRWIRQHNLARSGKPTSVLGLDALAIGPSMRAVAHGVAMAHAERVIELSRGFDIDGRSDQIAYNQLSIADRALLRRAFTDANQRSGEADIILERSRVVLQALNMLDAGTRGWSEGFALRDLAMADAVSRLLERSAPSDRFILLAHNSHIAAHRPAGAPAPMGEHLKARLGDAYFALGGSFGDARFNPPIYGVGAFEPVADTADQHIATLGHATALVDLRDAASDLPLPLQSAGLDAARTTLYPRRAFDALAFVGRLANAQQLIETELGLDAAAIDATRV